MSLLFPNQIAKWRLELYSLNFEQFKISFSSSMFYLILNEPFFQSTISSIISPLWIAIAIEPIKAYSWIISPPNQNPQENSVSPKLSLTVCSCINAMPRIIDFVLLIIFSLTIYHSKSIGGNRKAVHGTPYESSNYWIIVF